MHDCLGRVAALATKTELRQFMEFAAGYAPSPRKEPPYAEIHFYAYLLSCGFLCGSRLTPPEGKYFKLPEEGEISFMAMTSPAGEPALVITTSPHPDWDHAVYWDGAKIIDPADGGEHHPSRYKIKNWTPIHRLADDTSAVTG